jgi:AraC family transcriptional regulator
MNKLHNTRYQQIKRYIEDHLREDISISEIEKISYYSYRNINRIFLAKEGETIGKYIKRLRLQKAAEFLRFSNESISDIADHIGFNDIATFSKAFKKKFNASPSEFRQDFSIYTQWKDESSKNSQLNIHNSNITFEIETIPSFDYIYTEFKGSYDDHKAIQEKWDKLLAFFRKEKLETTQSIYFGSILDDEDFADKISCRYRAAISIQSPPKTMEESRFSLAVHQSQTYAKFLHYGAHEETDDTYHQIYANWPETVNRQFADAPVLEIYLDDTNHNQASLEIYIPIE